MSPTSKLWSSSRGSVGALDIQGNHVWAVSGGMKRGVNRD
jgi:hypothetical protein